MNSMTVDFGGLAKVVSGLVEDAVGLKDLTAEAREREEVGALKKWVAPFAEGLPGVERALAYYAAARFIEAEVLDERETKKPSESYLTVLVELKVRLARESDRVRGVTAPGFWSWLGATGVSHALDDGRRDDLDKILAERDFQASMTKNLEDAMGRVAATVRTCSVEQQDILRQQLAVMAEQRDLMREQTGLLRRLANQGARKRVVDVDADGNVGTTPKPNN